MIIVAIKRRKRPALTETLFVSTRNTLRSGAGVKKMMYAEAKIITKNPYT